jgi:hypothetical protein
MSTTAVSVTSNGTYGTNYTSSGATITGGSTFSLASGTTLNLQDGQTNTLAFSSTGSIASATLKFDLGAPSQTSDELTFAGAVTLSGTNTFSFNAIGSSLAIGTGVYTLITAAGGLNAGGTFTGPSSINVNGATYFLTYSNSATAETLTVAPPTFTWNGAASNAWDTASGNWYNSGTSTTGNFSNANAVEAYPPVR